MSDVLSSSADIGLVTVSAAPVVSLEDVQRHVQSLQKMQCTMYSVFVMERQVFVDIAQGKGTDRPYFAQWTPADAQAVLDRLPMVPLSTSPRESSMSAGANVRNWVQQLGVGILGEDPHRIRFEK